VQRPALLPLLNAHRLELQSGSSMQTEPDAPSVQVPSARPTRMAQRSASHCALLVQADPGVPSLHVPPPLELRAHSLSMQWVGLLQRSPGRPALHVQPAPAESCAQRPSAQSLSSSRSHTMPAAPVVHTLLEPVEEKARTQCFSSHCVLSEQGWPIFPSVHNPENELVAQVPVAQSLLPAHGSPTAPDEQRPPVPELPVTQRRSLAHWSLAEHVDPALPSVHMPSVELGELFPQ
jgi:hypothetical protein